MIQNNNSQTTALISLLTWNAVVTVTTASTITQYVMRHGDPIPQEEKELGSMYVQTLLDTTQESEHLFKIPAGNYPFSNIAELLHAGWQNKEALMMFLSIFDTVLPRELRKDSARCAEELFAKEEVYKTVQQQLLETKISDEIVFPPFSLNGKVQKLAIAMFEKWRPSAIPT